MFSSSNRHRHYFPVWSHLLISSFFLSPFLPPSLPPSLPASLSPCLPPSLPLKTLLHISGLSRACSFHSNKIIVKLQHIAEYDMRCITTNIESVNQYKQNIGCYGNQTLANTSRWQRTKIMCRKLIDLSQISSILDRGQGWESCDGGVDCYWEVCWQACTLTTEVYLLFLYHVWCIRMSIKCLRWWSSNILLHFFGLEMEWNAVETKSASASAGRYSRWAWKTSIYLDTARSRRSTHEVHD